MSDNKQTMIEIDNGDEPMSNHSDNPHFATILEKRLSRRQVLSGSLTAAVAGVFGASGMGNMAEAANPKKTATSRIVKWQTAVCIEADIGIRRDSYHAFRYRNPPARL